MRPRRRPIVIGCVCSTARDDQANGYHGSHGCIGDPVPSVEPSGGGEYQPIDEQDAQEAHAGERHPFGPARASFDPPLKHEEKYHDERRCGAAHATF